MTDIKILGLSLHTAGEPARESYRHQLQVQDSVPAERLELALAIMQCHMAFRTDQNGHVVYIETDAAGLAPTVHNARRRLVVALDEAERLLAEVRAAAAPTECRPTAIELLPSVGATDQGHGAVICISGKGYRHVDYRDGQQRTDCGGVRYTFPDGSPRGVVFEMAQDGWRRLHGWASTEESGPVLALLIAARLEQPCRLEAIAGWGRRRGFVLVPERAPLMDAIDAGNIVERLWKAATHRLYSAIAKLPWEGQDSLFEEAFSDVRDALLARLVDGGTLIGEWCGHEEVIGTVDGEPVEPAAIVRLLRRPRGLLEFEPNMPTGHFRVRLAAGVKLDARTLQPRRFSVSFRAFEENCQHRRHWQEYECLHPQGNRDRCGVATCPRVAAVYHTEASYSGDDPHFNRCGDDWDTQVVALHRNTEHSFAWRAAGVARVAVIVNKVAQAWLAMGAGYLCGTGEQSAVREAVALGHLTVFEETALGPIVRPSERLADALNHNTSA